MATASGAAAAATPSYLSRCTSRRAVASCRKAALTRSPPGSRRSPPAARPAPQSRQHEASSAPAVPQLTHHTTTPYPTVATCRARGPTGHRALTERAPRRSGDAPARLRRLSRPTPPSRTGTSPRAVPGMTRAGRGAGSLSTTLRG
jgi:hypothetical protein